MRFKNLITFILLATYMFLSTGCTCFASCLDLYANKHNARKITCCCCMNKAAQNSPQSKHMKHHCKCAEKQNFPTNVTTQITINSAQNAAYFENICNKICSIPCLIIFENISYEKFHPDSKLVLNKNLEILRTVILLD